MNIRGNVVDLKTQPSYTPSSSPVRWGYPPTTTRSICPWVYSGRKMGSICRWVSVCVFLFSMTDRFHQNMIRFNVYLHVYMLIYQYIYIYTIIYTQLYVYIYIYIIVHVLLHRNLINVEGLSSNHEYDRHIPRTASWRWRYPPNVRFWEENDDKPTFGIPYLYLFIYFQTHSYHFSGCRRVPAW